MDIAGAENTTKTCYKILDRIVFYSQCDWNVVLINTNYKKR